MQQQVTPPPRRRMIVGISGATGTIYGVRLLGALKRHDIETHLVISKPGERTLAYETDLKVLDLFDVEAGLVRRWSGKPTASTPAADAVA